VAISPFQWARTPRIVFGAGTLAQLGPLAADFGRRAVVITGARALQATGVLDEALAGLAAAGVSARVYTVAGEPTPDWVDRVVAETRGAPGGHDTSVDLVVALGGGSALDAGKAVSAMLPQAVGVERFLEGVGDLTHDGRKVPLVAVPTTAGTGSEATVNAVLSRVGPVGFKASLRHPHLAPDVALVDPRLALSCPPEVTAACGMDALTQLLEAYVSTQASPMTDALAESGLTAVRDSLLPAAREGATDLAARTGMAYAALLSGLALANAGLGVVHGLAGLIGGMVAVPHGVVCGTLVGAATRATIDRLRRVGGAGLRKYANAGRALGAACDGDEACCTFLVDRLEEWVEALRLPRLGGYGLTAENVESIAARRPNKNNPVRLEADEIAAVLRERM
jgi:alcohol dehydrogenase